MHEAGVQEGVSSGEWAWREGFDGCVWEGEVVGLCVWDSVWCVGVDTLEEHPLC